MLAHNDSHTSPAELRVALNAVQPRQVGERMSVIVINSFSTTFFLFFTFFFLFTFLLPDILRHSSTTAVTSTVTTTVTTAINTTPAVVIDTSAPRPIHPAPLRPV